MRRIVLDTNVVVSALLSPKGNAAVILGMAADGLLTPVYNGQIIEEYTTVLARPRFDFPQHLIDQTLDLFDVFGVPAEPQKSDFPMPDESDRIFYDTAVAGAAVLITGNLRHYPEKPFIVSPADFLLQL